MKKFLTITAATLFTATTLVATIAPSQARSLQAYCRAEARHAAREAGGNNVAAGALTGAAVGGLFGAITGHGAASNTLTGVAVGGIGGGALGAAGSNDAARQAYWEAYNDCMDNN
ncbi:MAG: hypothetical protein ABI230_09530 [Aestuariivirga sp.]